MIPSLRLALAAAAALVAAAAGGASTPVHAATAPTVVSIQFDDGSADQYGALAILNAHGMHATFYVNTGFTGDATHLSWPSSATSTPPATRSPATRSRTRT